MSVKISRINIYENNWQTTVHDPRTKNVVADVLSKGCRRWDIAYSRPYVFSALRRDSLSYFNFGEHRVPVYIVKRSFFCKGTWSQDFWFQLERGGIHSWGRTWTENKPNNSDHLNNSVCQEEIAEEISVVIGGVLACLVSFLLSFGNNIQILLWETILYLIHTVLLGLCVSALS